MAEILHHGKLLCVGISQGFILPEFHECRISPISITLTRTWQQAKRGLACQYYLPPWKKWKVTSAAGCWEQNTSRERLLEVMEGIGNQFASDNSREALALGGEVIPPLVCSTFDFMVGHGLVHRTPGAVIQDGDLLLPFSPQQKVASP